MAIDAGHPGPYGFARAGPREETSLLAFLSVLLRHRRLLALASLTGALIAGIMSITEASRYEARASFIARPPRSGSQSTGLLQQLGLAGGLGIDQSQTTLFYNELVRTKAILGPVSRASYSVATDSGVVRGTLASFHGYGDGSPEAGAALVVQDLLRSVSTGISSRTGIVVLKVESAEPALASQIATNIMTELNTHTAKRRRREVVEERAFVEQLLSQSLARLRLAENNLAGFREANRDYENSVLLKMQNDRLAQSVSMEQQIYTRMAGAYEQARIEEARDLSPIQVVEPAETPVYPQTGTAVRKTLLGLIAGLLVGIIIAFLRERMRETRAAGSAALAEFQRERANTWASLAGGIPLGKLLGRPK